MPVPLTSCHFIGGPMDGRTYFVPAGANGVNVPILDRDRGFGVIHYQRVGDLLLLVADPCPEAPDLTRPAT